MEILCGVSVQCGWLKQHGSPYADSTVHAKIKLSDKEIITTAEHPFWVCGKGWIAASSYFVSDNEILVHNQCSVNSSFTKHGGWRANNNDGYSSLPWD